MPPKIQGFNWLLKDGTFPRGNNPYRPPPEAHDSHTMVLLEGRYLSKRGLGRIPTREYAYRIVRTTDVEKLVKKFNSATAPEAFLDAIENSAWPFIKQIKREMKEKGEELGQAQEMVDNDEPLSDEQADLMTNASQDASSLERAALRKLYLPVLETDPFYRPILTLTVPTRPMAIALTQFCKALMHGTIFHTYIAKNGIMRSTKLTAKMKHYYPCLFVEDHQLNGEGSEKEKQKAKYHIQSRRLRLVRAAEMTYQLAEFVVGARGGLKGIQQVLRKTRRGTRRDQLRVGEPAADIVIDVGIGGSSWCEEDYDYDKWVAEYRDAIERLNNQFPDIMEITRDQYSTPIRLHRLDDFGRRYDMETGELVPWPEALKNEMPASFHEFRKMVDRKVRLEESLRFKPPGLELQQLRERSLELSRKKEELIMEALEYFEKHKLEIAMWMCRTDAHVTYFS